MPVSQKSRKGRVHFGSQYGAKTDQKYGPNSERKFEGVLMLIWSKVERVLDRFSTSSRQKRGNGEHVNFNNPPYEKLFFAVSPVPL